MIGSWQSVRPLNAIVVTWYCRVLWNVIDLSRGPCWRCVDRQTALWRKSQIENCDESLTKKWQVHAVPVSLSVKEKRANECSCWRKLWVFEVKHKMFRFSWILGALFEPADQLSCGTPGDCVVNTILLFASYYSAITTFDNGCRAHWMKYGIMPMNRMSVLMIIGTSL